MIQNQKGKLNRLLNSLKIILAKIECLTILSDWNHSCHAWLKRTGNYKVHHNTKKRPSEVHALEKQHLKKVSGTYIFENVSTPSITRIIHKDNVIRYEGNRYSVPQGTYRADAPNIAYLQEDEGWLIIRLKQTGYGWQSIEYQREKVSLFQIHHIENVVQVKERC